jgi:hypothetical protein
MVGRSSPMRGRRRLGRAPGFAQPRRWASDRSPKRSAATSAYLSTAHRRADHHCSLRWWLSTMKERQVQRCISVTRSSVPAGTTRKLRPILSTLVLHPKPSFYIASTTAGVEEAVENAIARSGKVGLWLRTFAEGPSFIQLALPCASKQSSISSLFGLLACFFPSLASLSSVSQSAWPYRKEARCKLWWA